MVRFFDIGQLRVVERECGFRYPDALWAAADELSAVARLPRFAEVFPHAHIANGTDVAAARGLGLSISLVPFMCELQPTHTDYYCCLLEDGGASSVFADHAVVADWPSFAAFVAWARQLCDVKTAY